MENGLRNYALEERSEAFFNIYLNLEHYIIEHRPSFKRKEISLGDLKEKIREHVNVKDLEDKFQLLFLTQDEMLVKLTGGLIKECIINFIDKKALVEDERTFFKKNNSLLFISYSSCYCRRINLSGYFSRRKSIK